MNLISNDNVCDNNKKVCRGEKIHLRACECVRCKVPSIANMRKCETRSNYKSNHIIAVSHLFNDCRLAPSVSFATTTTTAAAAAMAVERERFCVYECEQ